MRAHPFVNKGPPLRGDMFPGLTVPGDGDMIDERFIREVGLFGTEYRSSLSLSLCASFRLSDAGRSTRLSITRLNETLKGIS